MRAQIKVLLVAGALVATGLGFVAPASATTSVPVILTTNFVCSNGVCAIGPGDVALPLAAGLIATGGTGGGTECNPNTTAVTSGSLAPGLQLGEPICEWEITGTPTAAGPTRLL